MTKIIYGATLALAALLAGCGAPVVVPTPVVAAAPDAAFAEFERARAAGQEVLAIQPAQSLVAVTVRRGGSLARLGHDHVIASHTLEGYAAPGLHRTALRFKLEDMTVDEAGLRTAAGLPPPPSADAIAGTRRNMLEKVLDAEHYPWLVLKAEQAANNTFNADITLHGATRRYSVPVTIERKDGMLHATGSFTVKQSDFGITPFSVLGGAMVVQDQMELRFDISAR